MRDRVNTLGLGVCGTMTDLVLHKIYAMCNDLHVNVRLERYMLFTLVVPGGPWYWICKVVDTF